jgi:hypothetical protein
MPAHALEERKYFGGTSLSKIELSEVRDNEHSSPSLRYAEKLGIEDPPRDSSPEFPQPPENSSKISSSVGTEEAVDIFENNDGWIAPVRRFTHLPHDPDDFPEEAAPSAGKSGLLAGHRQVLTGEPAADHVYGCESL